MANETSCLGCAAGCDECEPCIGCGRPEESKVFTVVYVCEDGFVDDFTTEAHCADEAAAECMLAKPDCYRVTRVIEGV